MTEAPLAGVRVIDLAFGPLAAIGRFLAELGADVVRVEPPEGAEDRKVSPSIGGVSLSFAAANRGKRSVLLDLGTEKDRQQFEELLATADILIENAALGAPATKKLDVRDIFRRYPELVILSASGFGANGPLSDWQATDLVLHALTAELSRSGIPDRAPLPPPGSLAIECAVAQAIYVVVLAYFNRLNTGLGDLLDFALLDAAYHALDPAYGISGSATSGVPASKLPRGRPEARHQYPIIACADGYVRLCVLAPRQWQGMFEWMGRPEEFADPSYNTIKRRFTSRTLIPAIARFFAGRPRAELEAEGQSYGVPIASLLDLNEFIASEHVKMRQALRHVQIAPGVTAELPNGVLVIDGQRASVDTPAPLPGQHQNEMFASIAKTAKSALPPRRGRLLSGLRVLDFGVIVVGAEQGRLLADQGADVVKVESAAFPDGSRQTLDGAVISVTFAAGHRNKRSLGLNLRDPKGKALLLKLVKDTDVILSNFKPGTLESLDLGYETLSAINPRLIMLDSSAFGATGPWSRRLGYGPLVRASAGLTAQWRYPGEPSSFSDAITVYPDHVAARFGVVGVLALLIRRLRTGRGGTVSVAQAEVMLAHMATQIAAISLAEQGKSLDNRPARDTPWDVFPCAGDDEWCVITIRNDIDWANLCRVIARPDLAGDPLLADVNGRVAQRDRIHGAVIEWLASFNSTDAAEKLQSVGVPAAAMMRVGDLPAFAHFAEQDFFALAEHPLIPDPFFLETAPVRSERLATPPLGPAPLVGEHTVEIVVERLGLSLEEVTHLVETEVLSCHA